MTEQEVQQMFDELHQAILSLDSDLLNALQAELPPAMWADLQSGLTPESWKALVEYMDNEAQDDIVFYDIEDALDSTLLSRVNSYLYPPDPNAPTPPAPVNKKGKNGMVIFGVILAAIFIGLYLSKSGALG